MLQWPSYEDLLKLLQREFRGIAFHIPVRAAVRATAPEALVRANILNVMMMED